MSWWSPPVAFRPRRFSDGIRKSRVRCDMDLIAVTPTSLNDINAERYGTDDLPKRRRGERKKTHSTLSTCVGGGGGLTKSYPSEMIHFVCVETFSKAADEKKKLKEIYKPFNYFWINENYVN